jgi:glutamine synthetase
VKSVHAKNTLSYNEAIELAKKNGAQMVDFKFTDLYGTWHHLQTHINELHESIFKDGIAFDGSSLRGWQPIHQSDMVLIPDPGSAKMVNIKIFLLI